MVKRGVRANESGFLLRYAARLDESFQLSLSSLSSAEGPPQIFSEHQRDADGAEHKMLRTLGTRLHSFGSLVKIIEP